MLRRDSEPGAIPGIMLRMANHAFASFWCRNFSEETMVDRFGEFVSTAPFSTAHRGFTKFVIRAVDPSESPVAEHDLRAQPLEAAELVELAREYLHGDIAFETRAYWDLWTYEMSTGRWQLQPQPLELFCYGEEYDEGAWRETGHLHADIGFEHLFTGHAGLLGARRQAAAPPQHPAEQEFLTAMARPESLRAYHEKTQENIRKLLHWASQVEAAAPIEQFRLWSEGEENFEARMEEILAVR